MRQKMAAWSNDRENLFNSSSGGIFFELAKEMGDRGGKVAGVVMEGICAKYILSNDLEEIKKMRGSKYIPPDLSTIIKKLKHSTQPILFVGLPCHIEAVKKNYDTNNMILCDLICHGLPKKGVFEEHIKKISRGRDIESIRFRDKRAGWDTGNISYTLQVEFSNGDIYDKYDQYLVDYMSNKILRDSCKTCTMSKVGDITIGDFWRVPPSFKNKMGTSVVFLNNKKGKEFFISINSITKKKVRFYHYLNMVNFKYFIHSSLKKTGLLNPLKKIIMQG